MADGRRGLSAILVELAGLVGATSDTHSDADANVDVVAAADPHRRLHMTVAELQRRLREDRIRILVVGESKRGKSTFTNALIGAPVLPMGVTPLTAVATTLTYGSRPCVEVSTGLGPDRTEPLAALPGLVTEDGNPGNRLGLTAVVVKLDAPLLTEGIELVDTPGTGSVIEANTTEAEIAYQTMDAAIFVLSADPPISAAERELLAKLLPSSVATFIVLNKADRLSRDELESAKAFTARTVAEVAGRQLPIYVCSARQALETERTGPIASSPNDDLTVHGIDAFLQDFMAFLDTRRVSGLLTSLRRQAAGVVTQLLDEVTVTLRAAELSLTTGHSKVRLFRAHLEDLDRRQKEADDLVSGESRRLLAVLNESAAVFEPKIASGVSDALHSWLSTADQLANADLESQGHSVGSNLIAGEVEAWRSTQAQILQTRLDELDARLRESLDRDLASLRPAAAELLGIELSAEPMDVALAPSRRFYYQFRIDLDAAGTLAAGIRHLLPGKTGRTREARYVLSHMDRLARQQVGRARADLQERLAASTRSMHGALAERYVDHSRRMLAALDTAADLVRGTAEHGATQHAWLTHRRELLISLMERLSADGLNPTTTAPPGALEDALDGR